MLVEHQIIQEKWSRKNIEYYKNKGYIFTNYGDIFDVFADDLIHGSHKKVFAICDYCDNIYELEFRNYKKIENNNEKHVCNSCKLKKRHKKTLIQRQNALYEKLLQKCNENGYILLSKREDIQNNTTYIKYECPIHGVHEMRINNFLHNKKCPDCNYDAKRNKYKLPCDEVELRINQLGGILLNKEDYINRSTKNLKVLCPECGEPFITSLVIFTQHGGQVCEKCGTSHSVGELKIRQYLQSNNIAFEEQKWFADCRDINPLPFDFYLPNDNIIIEFDGRQHFSETNYFSYSYEKTHEHDEIKNKYCRDNNIYLIRIPYWDVDKIDKILDRELILHEDIV